MLSLTNTDHNVPFLKMTGKRISKKEKKGFTLVELLVVIAILAILASVSVLGYFSFTSQARLSADQALTVQINTLLKAEAIDHPEDIDTREEIQTYLLQQGLTMPLKPNSDGYEFCTYTNYGESKTKAAKRKSANTSSSILISMVYLCKASYEESGVLKSIDSVEYPSAEDSIKNVLLKAKETTDYLSYPLHTHDFNGTEASFTWSEDNSECVASITCTQCKNTITETSETISSRTEPTCTKEGEIIYTALFQNPLFATQTKTIPLPALGHTFVNGTCTICDCPEIIYIRDQINSSSFRSGYYVEAFDQSDSPYTWSDLITESNGNLEKWSEYKTNIAANEDICNYIKKNTNHDNHIIYTGNKSLTAIENSFADINQEKPPLQKANASLRQPNNSPESYGSSTDGSSSSIKASIIVSFLIGSDTDLDDSERNALPENSYSFITKDTEVNKYQYYYLLAWAFAENTYDMVSEYYFYIS